MNTLTFSTALVMALSTTAAFAHHPAADIVDAETYEMIDANVADTPHADLVFDDMGSSMDTAAGAPSGTPTETAGIEMDVDVAMDSAGTLDTMDLMENVVDTIAQ